MATNLPETVIFFRKAKRKSFYFSANAFSEQHEINCDKYSLLWLLNF